MTKESYYLLYSSMLDQTICRLYNKPYDFRGELLQTSLSITPGERLQILEDVQNFVGENIPLDVIRKVFLGWKEEDFQNEKIV